jgi:hypothetical protein
MSKTDPEAVLDLLRGASISGPPNGALEEVRYVEDEPPLPFMGNEPSRMFEAHDWHVCPEDYLWVRHRGSISRIGARRLQALLDGAKPESNAEHRLANEPAWLRTYLECVIGEECITINLDEPLPDLGGFAA